MTTELTRLGDVLELVRDPVDVDLTETYRKIGVRSFGKGIFHYDPTPGSELGKLRFYEVRADELVLSNIKAWEGAIAVSGDEDAGLVASNRFLTYRPRPPARVDVRYMRYLLLSEAGITHIQSASPGSADRNRTLGMKAFESIKLPLPDLERQMRIADQIEGVELKVMSVTEDLEAAKELYSKMVSALIHRADLNDEEKKARGWTYMPVGDFISLDVDEVYVDDDASYPMAGVYSFGKGLFKREDLAGDSTSYSKLHRLSEGQIVMSRLKGWEGALALVSTDFDGRHLSPEFPTFRVNQELADPRFVASMFATETFWSRLGRESTGLGARRERVHAKDLLELGAFLPPLSYQLSVNSELTHLREIANEERRGELLQAAIPSLLNATFGDREYGDV